MSQGKTMYYRNMNKHKQKTEAGIVSILTVLFLTVLLSVLTVAFLRVMNDEQEQTINDDLSKSAYASALTGIEDAKRAYAYCHSLSVAQKASCLSELTSSNCPGALSSGILTSGANPVLHPDGQVGGDPKLNQRYSCLLVKIITDNYMGQASESTPRLIELAPENGSFRSATLRWHRIGSGDGRDGPAEFYPGSTLPRAGSWNDTGKPAVGIIRAQVVAFEDSGSGGVMLSDMNRKSAATFFVPRAPTYGGVVSNPGLLDAPQTGSLNWRFQAGSRQNVACSASLSLNGGYSCEVNINFGRDISSPHASTDRNRYFLLVSSVYDDPHFEVALKDSANNIVNFYDVQPEVDVTGAAADAYRRIKARIEFSGGFTAKDSLQTATSLCKAFYVTNQPVTLLHLSGGKYRPSQNRLATGAACSGLTLDSTARYSVED